MATYTDAHSPNVQKIHDEKICIINSRVPTDIRKQLMAAVKANVLGWLPKDDLKPEVFFHPAYRIAAEKCQIEEGQNAAERRAKALASVVVSNVVYIDND